MARWDRLYLESVERAGIKMLLYERYVDDSNQVAVVPPEGWKYNSEEKRLVKENENQQEEKMPEDERIAYHKNEATNDKTQIKR